MEFQLTPGPPCEIYIVPSGFTTYCNIWLQALEIPSQINPLYSRGSEKKKKGYKSPLHNQMWRTFYHFVLGVDTQSYSRSSSLDSLKSLHLFFPLLLMMMFMEWSFSCQTGNWENLHHYPTSTGDSPHPLRELSPEGFLYFKYPYLQRMEPRWLTSQFYLGHGSHVEL